MTKDGGSCTQGALTATATSLKGAAKIQGSSPSAPSGELSFGQQQALAMINASNNQTAYANIAFFYLCQITGNLKDKLSADQVVQMWGQTNLAVATVGVAGTIPSTVNSASLESGTSGAQTDAGTTKSNSSNSPEVAPPITGAKSDGTIGITRKGVADALKSLGTSVQIPPSQANLPSNPPPNQ
jgi:hypothetical protein